MRQHGAHGAQGAQSAMEYLVTYGWAIMIMIVAAATLYALGIFGNASGARVQPGSCVVFRPDGAGTITGISLHGACLSGEPQFVLTSNAADTFVTGSNMINYGSEQSISGWIEPQSVALPVLFSDEIEGMTCPELVLGIDSNGNKPYVSRYTGGKQYRFEPASGAVSLNSWNFIAGSVDTGENAIIMLNGNVLTGTATYTGLSCGTAGVGASYKISSGVAGQISNLQVYSSVLGASAMKALYIEGVGGVPIDINHLMGWWPLNGDTLDYSGNGNNATSTNVVFNSTWTSGYTPP